MIATLAAGCSISPVDVLDALVPKSGYTRVADIPYGSHPRQQLDIYYPKSSARFSRHVLFVHGGAWRRGDKDNYRFVGQSLAAAGHVVIVPNYRLYPDVQHPAFVEDVVAALAHLAGGGDAWRGSPIEEIVLAGHSSGAHTAALLASDERYLTDSGIVPIGLIGISGPYDLPIDDEEVAPVFAGVDQASSVRPPSLADESHPPTLLMHGDDDKRVLPKHTKRYATALRQLGVPLELKWLDGAGHASAVAGLATPLTRLNEGREAVLAFLEGLTPGGVPRDPDVDRHSTNIGDVR